MQDFAQHLMEFQTFHDRRMVSFEDLLTRLNKLSIIQQAEIVLSEEGARYLLNARLSELMIPEYQYPEDKKTGLL